mmetsp:Transcript_26042/g.72803  ORF Transcript_26042/g.72803 Transcript_26042/m.72803 type:complete len:372 (-) Transcript_26042:130-1245(-)
MGMKRGQDFDAKVSKKQKVSGPMLRSVIDAIEASAKRQNIKENARSVLAELAKGGLGTPADDRHAFQNEAVDLVARMLESERVALQKLRDDAEGRVVEADNVINKASSETSTGEAELNLRKTSAKEAKWTLAEQSRALLAAKAALAEAERAQADGMMDLDAKKVRKEWLEAGLSKSFAPLRDGGIEGDTVDEHLRVMLAVAEQLKFEESLASAFKNACKRKGDARSGFDLVALKQFEEQLAEHIATLASAIEAAAPAAAAHQARIDEAKVKWETARDVQLHAATTFREADAAQKAASQALEELGRRAKSAAQFRSQAVTARDGCQSALDHFQSWPWACFETLRDRQSTKHEDSPERTAHAAEAAALAVGGQ